MFMILYYSATGNTEFAAKELARLIDDESLNLLQKIQTKDYSEIHSDKPFIICSPIYVCEMPIFVKRFFRKVKLTGSREVYFLFTSGGYSGTASVYARLWSLKHGFKYKGTIDLPMPRNYIASDAYPMQDGETVLKKIAEAKEKLSQVAKTIKEGGKVKSRHVFLFEILIVVPVEPVWRKLVLTAKAFYTLDSCIGCGKCAKLCPFNNIKITDKKPVWGKECTHCMACIANCPKESIEYGKITVGKARYLLKKWEK